MTAPSPARPRFLTLWKIRFPVGAVASIGHRVSGVVLLVALPWLASALERSLRSEADYDAIVASLHSPWAAPIGFVVAWALAHHVFAGIRHLLMDVGVGAPLRQARASARAAIGAGLAVAVLYLVWWAA